MSRTHNELCTHCEEWTMGTCDECGAPTCDDCYDQHEAELHDEDDE